MYELRTFTVICWSGRGYKESISAAKQIDAARVVEGRREIVEGEEKKDVCVKILYVS